MTPLARLRTILATCTALGALDCPRHGHCSCIDPEEDYQPDCALHGVGARHRRGERMKWKNRTPRRTLIDERDSWKRWCVQAESRERRQGELLEVAWGVIANAGGGDWGVEGAKWREAATRWRDDWHALLDAEEASS